MRPPRRRSARCWARARRRRRRSRSPGRSASCWSSAAERRWSSCSTISSGARRRSRPGRARRALSRARRSCCSAWPGRSCSSAARRGRSTLRLEPLAASDVDELIGERIPAARARIARRPAATHCSSRRCWRWPARRGSRGCCRRRCRRCSLHASISSTRPSAACSSAARSRGRCSTAAPCRRSPRRAPVTPRLAALVRKELIRPDQPTLGEDGFRFRHLLIRDAAYDALPKATRAELHERFAGWLSSRRRARRAGRDPRLPPRAGLRLPRRARDARRRRVGRGGAAAPGGRWPPRGPPPGLRRRCPPVRAPCRARIAGRVRPRASKPSSVDALF